MGQGPSKDPNMRMEELSRMLDQDHRVRDAWWWRMRDELAAGVPPTPGTATAAVYSALDHSHLVTLEMGAVTRHICG